MFLVVVVLRLIVLDFVQGFVELCHNLHYMRLRLCARHHQTVLLTFDTILHQLCYILQEFVPVLGEHQNLVMQPLRALPVRQTLHLLGLLMVDLVV